MAVYMKTLRGLFMAMQQYDAPGASAAMVFLRKADAEEQQFFEQYKPRASSGPRPRLTEDLWKNIYHPDEDRFVSHIFATVSQAVAAARRASTRTGASSARTSATSPPTSSCSARCSTTSTRCWACRSRSSTCDPSHRASWTWRTRARRRT